MVIALDAYHQITESLNLLQRIADGRMLGKTFKSTGIIFNRYDTFVENLQKVPITDIFDDYPENADPPNKDNVFDYISNMYKRLWTVHGQNRLYFHRTTQDTIGKTILT
eukprot:150848_1